MIYECHGHIILDGLTYQGAIARHQNGSDETFIRNNLKICAEQGIGYYRDGGDKHGVSLFAKDIAREYGIDYRTPVYIIHKKGYYGGMFGRAFDGLPEYRSLVAEAVRLGADFIKTTACGLLDFSRGGSVTGPAMTTGELSGMVNIAHGEGLSVMIHANGADNIKRAVESGADSIEHGFYMDLPALRMMANTGAVWVPTCATVSFLIGSGRYDDSVLLRILDGHKTALIEASLSGVPVACGSDAGASCVPQGAGTIGELTILESLGIDPEPGNRIIAETFRKK
jgi:imidazolonepropionase-like amidohydrolase